MKPDQRRLDAIYASLPTIECKRLCYDSCGPIGGGLIEAKRMIAARGGRPIGMAQPPAVVCPLLTTDNACSVYRVRPLLCRLWGVMDSLPCTYGCVPTPRYLTHDEGMRLLFEVIETLSDGQDFTTAPEAVIREMAAMHGKWRGLAAHVDRLETTR